MFIAALFILAKIFTQISINRPMDNFFFPMDKLNLHLYGSCIGWKILYHKQGSYHLGSPIDICIGILPSHKKNNEILPFVATWMDLENIMLSETSQTEKDKYCVILLICGILNLVQMNVYCKTEIDSQIWKTN